MENVVRFSAVEQAGSSAAMNSPVTGVSDCTRGLFVIPEMADSKLAEVDLRLANAPAGLLDQYLNHRKQAAHGIEQGFQNTSIPASGQSTSSYLDDLMMRLVAHATHTSSPTFIGHMTTALPQFVLPLSKLMTALNQNPVKVDTSASFTSMECQVTAMLHHLVYEEHDEFYRRWLHNNEGSLGLFCSGGTIANLSALWVARNRCFAANDDVAGIKQDGLPAAIANSKYDDVAVLVSERGHYSIGKAIDLLGLGRQSLITVPVDDQHKVRTDLLEEQCAELVSRNI